MSTALHLLRRLPDILMLALIFLSELVKSSVSVAQAAFARNPRIDSAILAVPVELRTDLGIAVLANMITLTPGTCSLHVSEDRRTIYVHALDASDPEGIIQGIHTAFERRIARIEP